MPAASDLDRPAETQTASDALREQFVDLKQQRSADRLGMWIFLTTEILMFGALFASYTVYRVAYAPAFATASNQLHLGLGVTNTVLLLTSSLTMALAVVASQARAWIWMLRCLSATALLGLAFLLIKGYEWQREYAEGLMPLSGLEFAVEGGDAGQVQMFFNLYFGMTGLHAVHLLIGIGLVLQLLWLTWSQYEPVRLEVNTEMTGLYWHLVDVIWVFMFPLLYLVKPYV